MNKKTISIESLFVMVLFMMFTISMVLMIISGKTGYTNILDDKEKAEQMRIASSYLRMKTKQNDLAHAVSTVHYTESGIDALEIKHNGKDSQYKTVIYYHDGKIFEAYLAVEDEFYPELGEPIMDMNADTIHFELGQKGLNITFVFAENEIKQFVALRSEVSR